MQFGAGPMVEFSGGAGDPSLLASQLMTIPSVGGPKNAFLVRIRRTGESSDGGTSGPTLPYLFGRGSLINRQLIGEGIKVRATAIAKASPVYSAGKTFKSLTGGNDIVTYVAYRDSHGEMENDF